ncbi:MAG TPA: hypothetical protein VIU12_23375 [Chryseolinea sp.]
MKFVWTIVPLLIILFSCSHDEDITIDVPVDVPGDTLVNVPVGTIGKAKLDIAGAKGLMVYENSTLSGGRVKTSGSTLYKILPSGESKLVQFVNGDGSAIDTTKMTAVVEVYGMKKLTDAYILMWGNFQVNDEAGNPLSYTNLLVRTADGAIYNFGESLPSWRDDNPAYYQDRNNNIYYRDGSMMIMKMSLSDPDNITVEAYLPEGQTAGAYTVDQDGNCLYTATNGLKIRKASGGLYADMSGVYGSVFTTLDNRLILLEGQDKRIIQYKVENGNVTKEILFSLTEYAQANIPADDYSSYTGNVGGSWYFTRAEDENFIYFVGGWAWSTVSKSDYVAHSLGRFPEMKILGITATHIYGRDNYKFYKVDKSTFQLEQIGLSATDTYEIYSATMSQEGEITFSALRYSDAIKIVATIKTDGTVVIIDEHSDRKLQALERIN